MVEPHFIQLLESGPAEEALIQSLWKYLDPSRVPLTPKPALEELWVYSFSEVALLSD